MKIGALLIMNQSRTSVCSFLAVCFFLASVAAEGADRHTNSLWELTTDFEVGSAGWQHYILPHYPPTQVDFRWETNSPGEGVRSVVLKPWFGLNSMPVSVKGNTEYTFSLLLRGDAESSLTMDVSCGSTYVRGGRIPVTTQWERKHIAFKTPGNSSNGIHFRIKNGAAPGTEKNIYLDALCLREGDAVGYVSGPYSLGLEADAPANLCLSNREIGVTAGLKLFPSDRPAPDDWRWVLNEVVPVEKTIDQRPVRWEKGASNGFHRAELTIPAGQGLYRVMLRKPGGDMTDPRHELLVGQAEFDSLPKLPDDPESSFLGVHYHNNWKEIDAHPFQLNLDTNQDRRWATIHHMGARWIRLHGGRPDFTKMYEVHPESMDEKRFYVAEMMRLKQSGFEILGILSVAFSREKRVPWFDFHETRGAWMGTQIPKEIGLWEQYISNVVTGYRDVIRFWEIYNEPNGQMSAENYIPLLKRGYAAAKLANPDVTVLGVCSTTDFGAHLDGFVTDCLENECGDSLDVLSFHPYIGYRSPESGGSAKVMETMRGFRDGYAPDKPLWNSEVGWRTYPSYAAHVLRAPEKNLSALDGAAYTARNILLARRIGLARYFMYGGAHTTFAFQNLEFSPMFEYDGSPSPLYFTVGTVVRLLQGVSFAAEVKLSDGIHGYLFDKPDSSVLAAVWTDNEVVEHRFSLRVAPLPENVWDGAGGSINPSVSAIEISRVPTYLVWRGVGVETVARILKEGRLEAAPDLYIDATLDTGKRPALALRVRNTMSVDTELTWVPAAGHIRRFVALAGRATEVDYVLLQAFQAPKALTGKLRRSFFDSTQVSIGSRYAIPEKALPAGLAIDGSLGEWIAPSPFALTDLSQITAGKAPVDRLKKQPVRIFSAANSNALALAIEAPKSKRGWSQTALGDGQYRMDSVELFFRTRPTEVNWIDTKYRKGDIKLSLAQDSSKRESKHINVDRGGDFVLTNGIDFAFADLPPGRKGYACEIRVPWSCFPDLEGKKPAFLGFDISMNLSEDGETRTFQYTWSGGGDNWKNTSRFGVIDLQ